MARQSVAGGDLQRDRRAAFAAEFHDVVNLGVCRT
jgi:hypothetical protein